MLPTLSLGPATIATAGLVYILGTWVVLTVVERAAKRLRQDVQATYGLAVVALVAGFIGARVVFVVLHWSAFQDNLIGIVWPLTSGYDAAGGLLIGAAAAVYYARWKHLPAARTLDVVAPALVTALMIASLADFLAGPGFGDETLVPWGIDLFGIRRHPVQIYELLVGILALVAWWYAVRLQAAPGRPFLFVVAAYSGGRLLVDAFRANSPITTGGYHLIQVVSLVVLVVTLFLLARGESPAEPVDSSKQASA